MKSVGKDKKGKLVQHFTSEAHHTAALHDLAHFVQGIKHVDVMLNKQLRAAKIQEEENDLRNQEIIKILLDVARTLGRQELPFRGGMMMKMATSSRSPLRRVRVRPKRS